jgi:hypothetical protein
MNVKGTGLCCTPVSFAVSTSVTVTANPMRPDTTGLVCRSDAAATVSAARLPWPAAVRGRENDDKGTAALWRGGGAGILFGVPAGVGARV